MKTTTQSTRKALLNDVDELKRNAFQVVQDVQDHANAHLNQTKQRVTDTIDTARESLVTRPFVILGVGFAMGLLFGLRLRR